MNQQKVNDAIAQLNEAQGKLRKHDAIRAIESGNIAEAIEILEDEGVDGYRLAVGSDQVRAIAEARKALYEALTENPSLVVEVAENPVVAALRKAREPKQYTEETAIDEALRMTSGKEIQAESTVGQLLGISQDEARAMMQARVRAGELGFSKMDNPTAGLSPYQYVRKKITPHKGGRTARLECRVKPETKRDLERLAAVYHETIADVIERLTVARIVELKLDEAIEIEPYWTCPECGYSHDVGQAYCDNCDYRPQNN